MRNFLIPSSLFASALVLGAFAACGGDDSGNAGDGGPTVDVLHADVSKDNNVATDSSVEGGMVSKNDLHGTDEFDVMIVSGPFGGPATATDKGTGVGSASIRVETYADNGASFLDFTADATGAAKLMLDKSKGPFNITAASAMIGTNAGGAASVINVANPSDVAGKVIWLPQALPQPTHVISGAITGLKNPTDSVQIDCADFNTQWLKHGSTTIANYSTTQVYIAADLSTVNLAALDIDNTTGCFGGPCVLQGVWTPDQVRANGPMSVGIDFTMNPQLPTTSTVTINLPTTGPLPAANVTKVGDLVGGTLMPGPWTNSTVEKVVGQSATYVGTGLLKMPVSGASAFQLQYFASGNLKPDVATAEFNDIPASPNGHANFITAFIKSFANLSTVTIPALTKLTVSANGSGNPTAMDDATVDFDATGADWVAAGIGEVNNASNNRTIWNIYEVGVKSSAPQHIPHLPAAVGLTDITSATNVQIYISALKGGGVPTDFADGTGSSVASLADWRYQYITELAATGR